MIGNYYGNPAGIPQQNSYYPMNSGAVPDNLTMLRNSQYQYQNPYQQPYQQPFSQQYQQNTPQIQQTTPQTSSNGMIWVQGEEAAKAYQTPNGSTVILWDSENQTIYIKSVDNNGMPSMRILDWTERNSSQKTPEPNIEQIDLQNFVTRDEFNALKSQFDGLISKRSNTKEKKTVTEDT